MTGDYRYAQITHTGVMHRFYLTIENRDRDWWRAVGCGHILKKSLIVVFEAHVTEADLMKVGGTNCSRCFGTAAKAPRGPDLVLGPERRSR